MFNPLYFIMAILIIFFVSGGFAASAIFDVIMFAAASISFRKIIE
jgi:hypothetical protein